MTSVGPTLHGAQRGLEYLNLVQEKSVVGPDISARDKITVLLLYRQQRRPPDPMIRSDLLCTLLRCSYK